MKNTNRCKIEIDENIYRLNRDDAIIVVFLTTITTQCTCTVEKPKRQ